MAGQAQLHFLKGVKPVSFGVSPYQQYQPLGNNLLFFANDGDHGYEWWTTDGTADGTHMIKDLYPGADGFSNLSSGASVSVLFKNLILLGGSYYVGTDAGHYDLVRTDGAESGTYSLADLSTDKKVVKGFMAAGNTLFIGIDHGGRFELWKTDGTKAGTQLVKDMGMGSASVLLGGWNDVVYFIGTDANGSELWKSDGTAAGTVRVRDINPGAGNGVTSTLSVVSGNSLYFQADDGVHGNELWKTDGTEAGTVLIRDIYPGSASSSVLRMLALPGGTVLFAADDGTHGYELWKTDGTEGGTTLIKDIYPGATASTPNNFFAFKDKLIFNAGDDAHGRELWISDGTVAGTAMIKDINPGSAAAINIVFGKALTVAGDKAFFVANDGVHGNELWKTDGTEGGTTLVKDMNPGAGATTYASDKPYPVDDKSVFFTRPNPITRIAELWTSDGTTAGTVPIYTDGPVSTIYAYNKLVYGVVNNTDLYVGSVVPQKQDQTVTFDPLPARTYGDADFALTATASSEGVVSYTSSDPTIAQVMPGNTVHILRAGTVTLTAGQAGSLGFNPAPDVSRVLTIGKAMLTITAVDKRKVSGEENPALEVTYSGFVNGDDAGVLTTPVTITTDADAGSGLGDYEITPSGATAENYAIAFVKGRLHIAAEPLKPQTITFDPLTGRPSADPDFDPGAMASSGLTVVYTTSDTTVATVVNGKIHLTGAGTVEITASQPGDDDWDAATPVTQTLTVDFSSQTLSFPALADKTYGDPVFDGGANSSAGLEVVYSSSNPAIALVTADNRIRISGAGTVEITASQPGNSAYSPAVHMTQTLHVGKASLTIRAEDKTKVQNELNPMLTMRFAGFVNDEDYSHFLTPLTIECPATTASAPGTYPIVPAGASSPDYDIHFIEGTLTVVPAIAARNTLQAWFSSPSVLQVILYLETAKKTALQLLDIKGNILVREELQAAKGLNNWTIPGTSWPAGAYILRALGDGIHLDKKILKVN